MLIMLLAAYARGTRGKESMKETIVYTATAIFALAALGFVIASLKWALTNQRVEPKLLYPKKEYSAVDEAQAVLEQYLRHLEWMGLTL
jgi:hypothetical protein